jgi:hypothetical protein
VRRNATELQRRDAHSLSSCLRACALARASEVRRVARCAPPARCSLARTLESRRAADSPRSAC